MADSARRNPIRIDRAALPKIGDRVLPKTGVLAGRATSYAAVMESLVSIYPGGAAAGALLLLRISLAGQLLFLKFATEVALPDWSSPIAVLVAVGIMAGICARACAVALSLGAAAGFLVLAAPLGPMIGFSAVASVALVVLGPGAWSVDARLFGRRVISLEG